GNRRVAWHTEVVVAEVGEQRRFPVCPASAWGTGGAVALQWIVEQREPAFPDRAQLRSAGQKVVVLAGERREVGIFGFVACDRGQRTIERHLRLIEDVVAEYRLEVGCVRRLTQLGADVGGRGIRHFVRGKEWPSRLLDQRDCATLAI